MDQPALDDLVELLDLERIEVNIFRGQSPDENRQRVFGGQVAGQALIAAGRTVEDAIRPGEPPRHVHSLHAYFLRPGDPTTPIVYEVDRIRDGKSFTTRRVNAIQHGRAIFTLVAPASRSKREASTTPCRCPKAFLNPNRSPISRRAWSLTRNRWATGHSPAPDRPALRHAAATGEGRSDDDEPGEAVQQVWFRADGKLPDDPLLHVCVAAYASDMTLLDSIFNAHRLKWEDGNIMGASLDHAMWFHRPFRADEWLLYDQISPSASGARGLAEGKIFTDGRPARRVGRAGGARSGDHEVRPSRRGAFALLTALATLIAGCGGHDGAPSSDRSEVVDTVALVQIASLNAPIAVALHPRETDTLFVAEKGGAVRRLHVAGGSATVDPQVVLDISDRVSTGGEQGLLGIAFGPTGSSLFADYTDRSGDTRVVEYAYANGRANRDAERLVLAVDQPFGNHNGGNIVFGPDGWLYIGMGDGGSAGDPQGNAQNDSSLLGKLVRIDASTPGTAPEIWAKGLRNPWRFSFDRSTGDLWIADVGQSQWEEINHVAGNPPGMNYGWNLREGKHTFSAGTTAGLTDPEYEYAHGVGNCSITGGFVYRGTAIRGLDGAFVFADYCAGRLMAAAGGALRDLDREVASPISFGEDAAGELFVLSQDGPVYQLVRG